MGKYFGTDGFRGEANVDLTSEHAYRIGKFIGWYYGREHKFAVLHGKAKRRTSYMFENALSAGLTASGAQLDGARQMLKEAVDERAPLEAKRSQTEKQAQDNLERELTACEQTLAETAKQAQTAAAQAETGRRKAEQAQNDLRAAQSSLSEMQSRVKMLTDMQHE